MKRLVRNLVLAASGALALGLAAPAHACARCDECPHRKAAAAEERKPAPPPPADGGAATSRPNCRCEQGANDRTWRPGQRDRARCGKGRKPAGDA